MAELVEVPLMELSLVLPMALFPLFTVDTTGAWQARLHTV